MTKINVAKITSRFLLVFYAIIALSLFYYLPQTEKVKLVGTEVKRMDKFSKTKQTKDIRFIVASELGTNKTLMFRNEDMPWPPYFKFDSGDLSGKVMNLEENMEEAVVLITHYGWRIPLLSLYPNATSLEVTSKDYQHTPWFNIIFLSVISTLAVIVYYLAVRKAKKYQRT